MGPAIRGQPARTSGVGERRLRTQFAALHAQVKELETRLGDLTAAEREELRRKRTQLRRIQDKQARGEF